jgi:hypothetical protein
MIIKKFFSNIKCCGKKFKYMVINKIIKDTKNHGASYRTK